jgi:hypothetical protein
LELVQLEVTQGSTQQAQRPLLLNFHTRFPIQIETVGSHGTKHFNLFVSND